MKRNTAERNKTKQKEQNKQTKRTGQEKNILYLRHVWHIKILTINYSFNLDNEDLLPQQTNKNKNKNKQEQVR